MNGSYRKTQGDLLGELLAGVGSYWKNFADDDGKVSHIVRSVQASGVYDNILDLARRLANTERGEVLGTSVQIPKDILMTKALDFFGLKERQDAYYLQRLAEEVGTTAEILISLDGLWSNMQGGTHVLRKGSVLDFSVQPSDSMDLDFISSVPSVKQDRLREVFLHFQDSPGVTFDASSIRCYYGEIYTLDVEVDDGYELAHLVVEAKDLPIRDKTMSVLYQTEGDVYMSRQYELYDYGEPDLITLDAGELQYIHITPASITPSDQTHNLTLDITGASGVVTTPSSLSDIPHGALVEIEIEIGDDYELHAIELINQAILPAAQDPNPRDSIPLDFYADVGSDIKWKMPMSDFGGVVPYKIKSGTEDLIINVDFDIEGDYIHFKTDPGQLFPDGTLCIEYGRREVQSIYKYHLSMGGASDTGEFIRLYRDTQSLDALLPAVASYAGRVVLPSDTKVSGVYTDGMVWTYITDKGPIRVGYPHNPLQVDITYPRGFIVGGGIYLYNGAHDWWKEIAHYGGIHSSAILDGWDFWVEDKDVAVVPQGVSGGKTHVRLADTGDESYWEFVKDAELDSGKYLNDIIGYTGNGMSVNALETFFNAGFKYNTAVLQVELEKFMPVSKILEFIDGNRPVDTNLVIILVQPVESEFVGIDNSESSFSYEHID
jgi:hypothetical protein